MPAKKNRKHTNKKAPVRGAAGRKGKQSQWSPSQGATEPEANVEGSSRSRDEFSGEEG